MARGRWVYVDNDNNEKNPSDMREQMRVKMCNKHGFHEDIHENCDPNDAWCKGYEAGWEDCKKKLSN